MRILHFSDLHLGVETYGHIDPDTGLSSRLQDFLAAFDQVVDYALNNNIHLVLFTGDAYKSREPSPTQQRELARRIARLTSANIPVVLLVGNHDQPQALGKANAVDIFDTLSIRNTIVADKPDIYRVETQAGPIQVVALPWLKRSVFLARDEAKNLSFEELNAQLRQKLTDILQSLVARLDTNIPAVLASHVWVDIAKPSGSERMLVLGSEPQLLLSTLANPAFSYVALGHIHRHQILSYRPVVAYAGSLERVNFNEEKEDKGFMVVDIERQEARPACSRLVEDSRNGDGELVEWVGGEKHALSKRSGDSVSESLPNGWDVRPEFHPVNARRFLTIDIKLDTQDLDPTATVLQTIERRREEICGAIVRMNLTMPPELEGQIRDNDVRRALESASYIATISRDVKREARLRLGGMAVEKMSPIKALEEYLKQRKVEPQRIQVLLEHGQKLLQEEPE